MEQSGIKQNEIEYWQKRAKSEYKYKGEVFYTVTPVPYYFARRNIVLNSLRKVMEIYHAKKICDVGCGDGEYLKKLYTEERRYYGVDISENMIEVAINRARKDNMKICYKVSDDGIQGVSDFDFIYSVSLFAHIEDGDMKKLFENIYKNLTRGGVFCICEQIAPYKYGGQGWQRRTFKDYIDCLYEAGFRESKRFSSFRIDFRFHRIIFERWIAKKFYKKTSRKGEESESVRIRCNKNRLFLGCSWIAAKLSIKKIHKRRLDGWGYCFICVEK